MLNNLQNFNPSIFYNLRPLVINVDVDIFVSVINSELYLLIIHTFYIFIKFRFKFKYANSINRVLVDFLLFSSLLFSWLPQSITSKSMAPAPPQLRRQRRRHKPVTSPPPPPPMLSRASSTASRPISPSLLAARLPLGLLQLFPFQKLRILHFSIAFSLPPPNSASSNSPITKSPLASLSLPSRNPPRSSVFRWRRRNLCFRRTGRSDSKATEMKIQTEAETAIRFRSVSIRRRAPPIQPRFPYIRCRSSFVQWRSSD